jgi:hypothetical protein
MQAAKAAAERIPQCWEYWHDHNPKNATTCEECWRKAKPSVQFCWLVEGTIEGVTFRYINEDCESCEYYLKFSPVMQQKEPVAEKK